MSSETSAYANVSLSQVKEWTSAVGGNGKVVLNKDNSSGIATICLTNPSKRNAIDGSMLCQFSACLDELEAWTEGKAVILHGSEGFFCSGIDLKVVKAIIDHPDQARTMAISLGDTLYRLEKLPMLTVALVEGKAIGGGAELTTACNFRVLQPKSEIAFVHAKMGITFASGAGVRLVKLLGYTKALEILVNAKNVSAQEALDIGLADLILKDNQTPNLTQVKDWLMKKLWPPQADTSMSCRNGQHSGF